MDKAIWIRKNHIDYLGMKWVMKAVKSISDEGENILAQVEIKDHLATACDGNRLHEYTLSIPEDFPNGIYRPFRSKENLIFILDETRRVFPDTFSIFPTDQPIKILQITMGKGRLFDWAYTQIVRNISEIITIQINFLEKMLSGDLNWQVNLFEKNKPCLFISTGKRGLIMPLCKRESLT